MSAIKSGLSHTLMYGITKPTCSILLRKERIELNLMIFLSHSVGLLDFTVNFTML